MSGDTARPQGGEFGWWLDGRDLAEGDVGQLRKNKGKNKWMLSIWKSAS